MFIIINKLKKNQFISKMIITQNYKRCVILNLWRLTLWGKEERISEELIDLIFYIEIRSTFQDIHSIHNLSWNLILKWFYIFRWLVFC